MTRDFQGTACVVPSGLFYELAKRAIDIFGALLGICLLSPFIPVIVLAVKMTSPGPVFYTGVRTGLYGNPFRIFKFRTMVTGADLGAGTTSRADARVTPVGKFLRRHKLDEIPQLVNVLLGQMSLVGPRPELARYTNEYEGDQLIILQVKPGITDYASLKFSNLNDLIHDDDPDSSFEELVLPEKNRLRIKYVRERGFWLDMRLIFLTLGRVLRIP